MPNDKLHRSMRSVGGNMLVTHEFLFDAGTRYTGDVWHATEHNSQSEELESCSTLDTFGRCVE